jgi:hypothetical protein
MFTLESMGVNELVTVRQCVGDLSNAESVNDLMCLRQSRQQRIIISKKKTSNSHIRHCFVIFLIC